MRWQVIWASQFRIDPPSILRPTHITVRPPIDPASMECGSMSSGSSFRSTLEPFRSVYWFR